MNDENGNGNHDRLLTRRLKTGEAGAFKELVERYQDRVLNTCYRFLLNREDAEDTAQEVFIEVHRSIGSFREDAKISTWIYRIAVTRSLDAIRKHRRKKRFAPMKSLFGLQEEGKDIPDTGDTDPPDNLEQEQQMQILKDAVDSLPESQRIAFTLSKIDGLRNKEITAVMGLSLSAVEALVHRAKKNLRKKLHRHYESQLKTRGTLLTLVMLLLPLPLAGLMADPLWEPWKIEKKAPVFFRINVSIHRGAQPPVLGAAQPPLR